MSNSDPAADFTPFEGDAWFARLADAAQAYIWILDAAGRIVHANALARDLHDGGANNCSLNIRDVWPKHNRFSVERGLAEAKAGRAFRSRSRFRTPNDVDVYLNATVSPIRDLDGAIVRILFKAVDVTAQVESAAFLNTVIDVLPLALTVKDARTGRYILGNRAAEALFDQPNGLSGLRPADVLPAPFAAWEATQHPNPAALQSAIHHDITPRRERWLSAVKVATYDDDGVRHVIGLAEDVTQRRRDETALREALELARQAERARTAFLSNVSHELRTPLNGVIAGLDILARRSGADAEVVEMARTSAAALERRLEDLMRMTELGDDEGAARIEPIDAVVLLDRLVARFEDAAAARGLTLEVQSGPIGVLQGDRTCLEEALTRLLDNAVKFSDGGRIVLTAERRANGWTRFSILDQGVGFDPSLKARLFDGFQQGDDSLTRRHGGLGLGLAIAREAARRLGGALDADPLPGGGSCFWIEAPLSAPAATAPSVPDLGPRAARILVADDHPTNRRMVELMLDGLAEVVSVQDGQEAVEAAAREPFDLILMDIQMPRMDGVAAVSHIRAGEAATGRPRTPILMLTANTQPEHVEASRAAGADRHIGKPFTAAVLLDAIDSALGAA